MSAQPQPSLSSNRPTCQGLQHLHQQLMCHAWETQNLEQQATLASAQAVAAAHQLSRVGQWQQQVIQHTQQQAG